MTTAEGRASFATRARPKGSTLICSGDWTVRHLQLVEEDLNGVRWPSGPIRLDMGGVQRMDTGGAWVLQRLLVLLESSGHEVELHALAPRFAGLLQLVARTQVTAGAVPRPQRQAMLEQLGHRAIDGLSQGIGLIAFVGEIGAAWVRQLMHPGRIRWAQIASNLGEAGHSALGIVGLLSFLLGIVIAYQGGVQLRQYGASLFVADLVGLSMVRELAPLITAIIVAGRTGSAYTAQIGTMQVTEEVDALRSMGIPPMDLLVLPKLFALIVALPLLTVFADIMGVLGGMLMSSVQLEIAFSTYIDRLGVAISVDSFLVGVGKAPVFAAIIATIGCFQGFQVVGSAESVGRRTTMSVVQSILAVIVVDAAFSVAFSRLGI
ncbi:MAG: MlaE family lipid ABC transporter permease subunit [Chromatiaceae bacterium]|nr:MlaE family lipid ABC transporter permease subunit [Chromatiaceae bacterium]MCP5439266.1 MlaE family lipid ABC transporter permease subunit [Chromatiaceae bacterium]